MRIAVVCVCVHLAGCWLAEGDDYQDAVCGDGQREYGEESCDDGNQNDGDGCSRYCVVEAAIDATWTVQSYDGASTGCPAGYDTVALVTETTDHEREGKTFPCADGRGRMPVSADSWGAPTVTATLALVSATQTLTLARTDRPYMTYPPPALDFKLYTDAGYFTVAWNWTQCAGRTVHVAATSKTTPFTMTWMRDCDQYGGLTEVVPLGDYTLTLDDRVHTGSVDVSITSLVEIADAGLVPWN